VDARERALPRRAVHRDQRRLELGDETGQRPPMVRARDALQGRRDRPRSLEERREKAAQ
jgi:hypothetical protein